MPVTTLAERLKRARVLSGKSMGEYLESLGIAQTTYSGYERGTSPVKADILRKIIEVTGVSSNWLLFGRELDDSGSGTQGQSFPVYACGDGMNWAVSEQAEPYQRALPGRLIGYKVSGDSMEPVAREGQTVLCSPDSGDVKTGDLAYVELEDGIATFKRVLYKDNLVVLQPVNPSHDAVIVNRSDIRRAIRAVGVLF